MYMYIYVYKYIYILFFLYLYTISIIIYIYIQVPDGRPRHRAFSAHARTPSPWTPSSWKCIQNVFKMCPKRSQNRPKTAPRASWDRSWHHVGSQGWPRHEKVPKRAFGFPSSGAKLGAFWDHFSMIFLCNFLFVLSPSKNPTFLLKWSQILPQILPKMLPKSIGTCMQKPPTKIYTKNVKE